MKLSDSDIARFWSKVDIRAANKCWLWKGNTQKNGYGAFTVGGHLRTTYRAHRIAWQIANGREPREGFDIAHAPIVCHNRACCNPNHLSEKTHKENMADRELDETMNRGTRNGNYTHPESTRRGERHNMAKLSQADVDHIRALRKQGLLMRVIGTMFNIGISQVSYIVNYKGWKDQ